ncbi:MAG: hypothetical protein JWP19_178 [Rhodoglobus sp.]|nr:hypothetical protein [Rhodoglobus sp.]
MALILATVGVLAATPAPARAVAPSTDFWSGKTVGAPQPAPGDQAGIITIRDANAQASKGEVVVFTVSGYCQDATADGNAASIWLELDGATFPVLATWNTAGTPNIFSAQVSVTVTDNNRDGFAPLQLHADGAACYTGDGTSSIDELVMTFVLPLGLAPGCPGDAPGVRLNSLPQDGPIGTYAYPVTDPAGTYTTNWGTEARGMVTTLQGVSVPGGDYLQTTNSFFGASVAGWIGFSQVMQTSLDDQTYTTESCTVRDVATASDYSGSLTPFHGLGVTTQDTYVSADLLRHVWTLTNGTASDAGGFPVSMMSTPWDNTNTLTLDTTTWGATFDDGLGLNDPVVTHLWGGADVQVEPAPALDVVPLASNVYAARDAETGWLADRASMPDAYFADIPGDILNWGAGAETPDVTIGNGVVVGLDLPTIAPGASISIVEFAHVQYVTFGGAVQCPAFPGAPITLDGNGDTAPVVTSDPAATYDTSWSSNPGGYLEDAAGTTAGNDPLQGNAFDGFSSSLTTPDDSVAFYPACTYRDGTSDYSYDPAQLDHLTVTAQTSYVAADLSRRAWTFTNNGGVAVGDVDVTIGTNLGSDGPTTQVATTSFGRVTSDPSEQTPVVTMLWGGPAPSVLPTAQFTVAGIAASAAAAAAESRTWLSDALVISDQYFDDLAGPVLNWGDTAQAARVDDGAGGQADAVNTTYHLPSVAPGQSVTIVEFAHLQYFAPSLDIPTWTDVDPGAFYLGVPATDAIAASPAVTGYTLQSGDLPDGVTIDSDGLLGGTPTTLGEYDFTIRATNANGFADQQFTGSVLGAEMHLELGFQVGTDIRDATITGVAGGLEVGSTWTMTLYSTPIVIGSGVVGPSGILNALIALPASTPPGQHRIVLTGVAPGGTPLSTTVWFTLGANGVIVAVSLSGPTPSLAELASTGASPWDPVRLALLLVGVGVVLFVRRRGRTVLA